MAILSQFLLRLAFGLAVGMGITSSRQVTSGYFRNHLYVTLGLATLAAIVNYSAAAGVFRYAVVAAVASYVGSVCWLYEKPAAGKIALCVVALSSLFGAIELGAGPASDPNNDIIFERYNPLGTGQPSAEEVAGQYSVLAQNLWGAWRAFLSGFSNLSSGLLLGITMASMLLGHWYLNSPTMELAPLRRLLMAMGVAVALQATVSAIGLGFDLRYQTDLDTSWLLFLLLRWSFGLIGVAVLTWMAWQTLKIPNTQSATGILYVAVIGTFVGELAGLLLSAESAFPL